MTANPIEENEMAMSQIFKTSIIDKPEFMFNVVELQGHKVLTVYGYVDAHTGSQFKKSIIDVLDGTNKDLIIDMRNVSYMDSTGISILVSVLKRISPYGGTVNLVGCEPHIDRLFSVTKMSSFIALHQNMDIAMEALNTDRSVLFASGH